MGLFGKGVSLGQSGATSTPKQDTWQKQNQIDAGFNVGRQTPPPQPPRPIQPPPNTGRR